MESKQIYEESCNYLKQLNKSITTTDSITIDFTKLDIVSDGILRNTLSRCIFKRTNEIAKQVGEEKL